MPGSDRIEVSSSAFRLGQDGVKRFFTVELHLDFQNDLSRRFRHVIYRQIVSCYSLFSDGLALPKKGASMSMGKGNRMTLLLSVAMPANVCK